QFAGGFLVEAFDCGEILEIDEGDFLNRGKAFRGEQLADDLVDIERRNEKRRTLLELLLAALGLLLLGQDVDVPAGELRGEAHVVDVGADAIAVAEGFARDQFVAAHDALAPAEIDDDVAVFDALDLTVDDLADAVLELLVLAVALGVAHLLDDDLLGGLGGDAA